MAEEQKVTRAFNEHMVGMHPTGEIVIVNPPKGPITPAQAINLALWLVAVTDVPPEAFGKAVHAIRESRPQ